MKLINNLFFLAILPVIISVTFVSNTDKIKTHLDFKCTDYHSGKKISNISILIAHNDSSNSKYRTDTMGRCRNVILDNHNTYYIYCSHPGYLSKSFILDFSNFPDSLYSKGYEIPLYLEFHDRLLYSQCVNANSMDTMTIATLRFNEKTQDIEWILNQEYKNAILSCTRKIEEQKKWKEQNAKQDELENQNSK